MEKFWGFAILEALHLEVMEEERREFSVTRSWIGQLHKKQKSLQNTPLSDAKIQKVQRFEL